jgi:hypothetical protein
LRALADLGGLLLGTDSAAGIIAISSHSGPLLDISITETSSGAACVNITQSAQPRGIHGVNCTSNSNSNARIYLDGSNVSLEDIYVDGFSDGIRE